MLTFTDRLLFADRRAARRALTHGVQRLAARAHAARQRRWTVAAPSAGMGDSALTRALRWPWQGGYVSMARRAGLERIETSCNLWTVPTCEAPLFFTASCSPVLFLAA